MSDECKAMSDDFAHCSTLIHNAGRDEGVKVPPSISVAPVKYFSIVQLALWTKSLSSFLFLLK